MHLTRGHSFAVQTCNFNLCLHFLRRQAENTGVCISHTLSTSMQNLSRTQLCVKTIYCTLKKIQQLKKICVNLSVTCNQHTQEQINTRRRDAERQMLKKQMWIKLRADQYLYSSPSTSQQEFRSQRGRMGCKVGEMFPRQDMKGAASHGMNGFWWRRRFLHKNTHFITILCACTQGYPHPQQQQKKCLSFECFQHKRLNIIPTFSVSA